MEVEFQRRAESKATSTRKRSGTKARDIYLKYPKEKAKALIKRLYDRGLWYYDPDFDKDEEDWGEKGGFGNGPIFTNPVDSHAKLEEHHNFFFVVFFFFKCTSMNQLENLYLLLDVASFGWL